MPKVRQPGSRSSLAPVTVRLQARADRISRLWLALAAAANLLPVPLVFYFVYRYGVDLPIWDEWNGLIAGTLEKWDQGTFNLSAIFALHNEHRIAFTRLLSLANALLFHWNRKVEMYITAALFVITAALLFRYAQRYWNNRWAPVAFVPLSWLLLSWRQWGNLLMGCQTQVSLTVLAAVAAFFLLYKTRGADRYSVAASAAGFVATFSSGWGLLFWPVGAAQLLVQRLYGEPQEKPRPSAAIVWLGVGIPSCVAYLAGSQQNVHSSDGWVYLLKHPLQAIEYMALMLGSPLTFQMQTARSIGILVGVLSAYGVFLLLRRRHALIVPAAPWLSLILLTILSTLLVCSGRLSIGIGQALSSRYCSMTMLGIVAAYVLLWKDVLDAPRPIPVAAFGGMLVLLVSGMLTNATSWSDDPEYAHVADEIVVGQYAVRNANTVGRQALMSIHPAPWFVRRYTALLRNHGYSLFHDQPPPGLPARDLGSAQGCALDAINRQRFPVEVHRSDGDAFQLAGWAVDASARDLPAGVFLSVDGKFDFPVASGTRRADVAETFGNRNYLQSGIVAYPKIASIPDGDHVLSLKVVSHDGAGYWTCTAGPPHVLRILP